MSTSKIVAPTRRDREEVIEHDGMLWKPRPGAMTTAQEVVNARTTMIAIHKDSAWNPWVREDRADELERAERQFSEWTRAEPGFKPMTMAQWRARERRDAAKAKKQYEKEELAREERRRQYDAGREADRLALLELENGQRRCRREHDGLVDRTRFPAMDERRRTTAIAECRSQLEQYATRVAQLQQRVGDPETVVDEHGWLPRERREHTRLMLSIRREREVRELRSQVSELSATLDATKGRQERADLRSKLAAADRRLDSWLAVPPVKPEEMCSECYALEEWHETGTLGDLTGPCPAWPQWAARLQQARAMLLSFSSKEREPATPPKPQPKPIAVLPSGLSIGEVIARLTELQAEHPDAEVRRGRANRWEIWPQPEAPTSTGSEEKST